MNPRKKIESACPLWVEFQKAKEATREIMRKDILRQLDAALDTLYETYSFDEVYLIGSIIKEGKFSSESDVDIAIKGLNKFEHFSFIGDLSSLLGRDVDVIRMEDCRFSDSIISGGVKWRSKKNSPSS